MVCVSAHTETDDFSVDPGATGLGVFIFFQNQYAGTFTQNKTIPVLIPRS